jgi:EAL domain-containing protein (putative c-di-GMP-specific phosphodiesterase class I)/GGDEF domain-containing protein
MYRQLWLLLLLTTLLSLIWGLSASTLSARAYLQEQLRLKNNDNATTLALALSQREVDPVGIELMVSALFDSGNYDLIRITNPHGQVLAERKGVDQEALAPAWFIHLLPIAAPPGQAQIAYGWKQVGSVTLTSHSRFAYGALWNAAWQMCGALGLAGLISATLGSLILHRIRRPLQDVIEQANAISERRFMTKPESKVPELRSLTLAMNSVVQRLKAMFEEEAARLEQVRQQANQDSQTGLANRSFFLARLRANLALEEAQNGCLLLLRIYQLGELNRRIGRADTDKLILQVSQAIHKMAAQYPESVAGRLNGADFGLLLPQNVGAQAAADLLQGLIQSSGPLLGQSSVACIGHGAYQAGQDASQLLAQIDTALAAAEARGGNTIEAAQTGADMPRSQSEWGELLQQAVLQRRLKLAEFPVVNFNGQLLHSECPLRLALTEHSGWLPAGQFWPLAERLELTAELDLAAVALGLQQLAVHHNLAGLAINLSASSIQHGHFRSQLRDMLQHHPAVRQRLWLEVAELGALAHFTAFQQFCRDLTGLGCQLGLEHFGRQFAQIGQLHDLGLNYLKVDASFIHHIENSPGNQAFLKGLCAIAHSIDLQVIGEGVSNQAEFQALAALGFNGATGPGVAWPPA